MVLSSASMPLLIVAAAGVAVVHSIMPDHWVPLAIVARSNRWSLGRTARVSLLAALGHTVASVGLGIAIAAIGLAFRNAIISQEGHVVGGTLVITGLGFLVFAIWQNARGHLAHDHAHPHAHPHVHPHTHLDGEAAHDHRTKAAGMHTSHAEVRHVRIRARGGMHAAPNAHVHHHSHASDAAGHPSNGRRTGTLSQIIVPFGVAASPDLTILPVFLAASALGVFPAVVVLIVFAIATLATFVALTVGATLGGYQVEWPWLERNGHLVSALLLIAIGILAYLRF